MPYQGRQPGVGVRGRFVYTATGGQTTFSGADNNGRTLSYQDGAYVDVYLNGVMLVPTTDFTATTKTSIALTSGATASDIFEILEYDISSIADTVSASNGGTFDGAVTFSGGATGISESFIITIEGSGGSSDWTGSDPYTAVMTVSGILSTDAPIVDIDLSSVTYADVPDVQADWALVYRVAATDDDELTFYATAEPTEDFDVQIQVVR